MASSTSSTSDPTLKTKLRHLRPKERNKLCMILNVNRGWFELAGVIRNPDNPNEFLLTADNISILNYEHKPAEVLLEHWSTSGRKHPTLQDMLQYLKEANLLRAAHYVEHEILKSDTGDDTTIAVSEQLESVVQRVSESTDMFEMLNDVNEKLQGIDLSDMNLYSSEDIAVATRNFCPVRIEEGGCKIGEGAYGAVFLASLKGSIVAVKQLKEPIDKQFFAELGILMRCKHENILGLLGCSIDGPYCCLVYEYMMNGSLQERIACYKNSPPLQPSTRLSIAYGSAVGISYLNTFEEKPLVHRDIKSANILLDQNFVPKIGDFGLIRIGDSNLSSTITVTKNILGTSVYMAREAFNGDVSVKLDTFSYGVVLLELLTGLPPYDPQREDRDLITHVENCDDILTMLDPKVEWKPESAVELYNIAKLCLTNIKKRRPTLSEVVPIFLKKNLV